MYQQVAPIEIYVTKKESEQQENDKNKQTKQKTPYF